MRLLRYREPKIVKTARKNRLEIVAAGLKRRDLARAGLLTGAGYLAHKHGLSHWASAPAWAQGPVPNVREEPPASPPTRAFVEPLPRMPVKQPVAKLTGPPPTIEPNRAAGEGRRRAHQAFQKYPQTFPFPPKVLYETRQKAGVVHMSPDLPPQTIWGYDGIYPGPTYQARYGEQILLRSWNDLPPPGQNGGFGVPEVIIHLHNSHTPSESDGFPCDYYGRGQYFDYHYPNALAGFASTHKPHGDIHEALSTLWYHDHRVEFTSQNIYKGLQGFYLLYNEHDTGDETRGFRLPGRRDPKNAFAPVEYDVPLLLADRVFDPDTGLLFYDLFNLDGILGDKFLVNGKIQPFYEVKPRRYRFRVLNGGPSRFYDLYLTDKGSRSEIPFWVVANDGNLLPRPVSVKNIPISVAERMDIVIDFRPFAGKTLYLENRMEQASGRGPTGRTLPAGRGDFLLQFRVGGGPVEDASADPAQMKLYGLPDRTEEPRITRKFTFFRRSGMWHINERLMSMDCSDVRLRVKQNSAERWILHNNSVFWMHPIHIHFEEFQIHMREVPRVGAPPVEAGRKDVIRIGHNQTSMIAMRFRDFDGRYPMHCHNVVHEDDAMMLRWDIDAEGDESFEP
jgi:FtsP/CotA-like multicopper oxidase with cupredoxin domain